MGALQVRYRYRSPPVVLLDVHLGNHYTLYFFKRLKGQAAERTAAVTELLNGLKRRRKCEPGSFVKCRPSAALFR